MEKRDEIKNIVNSAEQKRFERTLSNDFCVFIKIYEITELKKDVIYFSKLVNLMEMNKNTISKSVDRLFDLGMIYGNWNYVNSEKAWIRTLHVDEDSLGLATSLYNATKPSKQQKTKSEQTEEKSFGEK